MCVCMLLMQFTCRKQFCWEYGLSLDSGLLQKPTPPLSHRNANTYLPQAYDHFHTWLLNLFPCWSRIICTRDYPVTHMYSHCAYSAVSAVAGPAVIQSHWPVVWFHFLELTVIHRVVLMGYSLPGHYTKQCLFPAQENAICVIISRHSFLNVIWKVRVIFFCLYFKNCISLRR